MINVLIIVSCLIIIRFLISFYLKPRLSYWKKKGVPFAEPTSILGNYAGYILLKKYIGFVLQDLCYKFPNAPYFGALFGTEPTLVIKDPETIKLVMTKDFYYFSGREISNYTHNEVFTKNIFFSGGDRWRVVRQNLTPLFSSTRMKNMFYLVENCSLAFETMMTEEIGEQGEVDIRSVLSRYFMGVIGSCAFGVDTRTIDKDQNKNNAFYTIGHSIFVGTNFRGMKTVVRAIWPSIFYGLNFKLFPQSINNFFSDLLTTVFQSRDYKPSERNDFVDLILTFNENSYITGDSLCNMKDNGTQKAKVNVDNELLVAQCITFFAAGFETSATTAAFLLYELAKNPKEQKLAQEEVDNFLKQNKNRITYDCMKELPYLEACISETLRLYPVLAHLTREVIEDYTMPSGLVLEKGMRVHIPVYHMHYNPDYFPEPGQFKPDRFMPENKANIKQYTFFPFGEGPRKCIGLRFAKMQMFAGLVTILKQYQVELAPGTPRTVRFDPRNIITQPTEALRLTLRRRSGWEQRPLIKSS